jgi:hypothetical protein
MTQFATFIVESKSDADVENDKRQIEKLREQNRNIVTIRKIPRDSSVDQVIASESGSGLKFKGTKADIMVEVKVNKDTDLNKIEGNLKTIGKSVTIVY